MRRRPPRSTLFPYTTPFRSCPAKGVLQLAEALRARPECPDDAHDPLLPEDGERRGGCVAAVRLRRSEEHTSELQSRQYLVCRLLLEKTNKDAMPSTFVLLRT